MISCFFNSFTTVKNHKFSEFRFSWIFYSANVLRYLFCFQNIGKTLVSTFVQQSTFSIYSKKTPCRYCRCFAGILYLPNRNNNLNAKNTVVLPTCVSFAKKLASCQIHSKQRVTKSFAKEQTRKTNLPDSCSFQFREIVLIGWL